MKKFLGLMFLIAYAAMGGATSVPADKKLRLTEGWTFLKSDLGNVWEAVRPPQKEDVPLWEKVTLPHCFNAEDAVDPDVNYYQGPGWYRTTLALENPYPGGRTLLEFEGAGQKTEVYVYTTLVGTHTGGYDGWFVDITDAAAAFLATPEAERFGGKVPVSIRCDNSRNTEMMPSDLSDFNLYGGLYRYVNLVYTPPVTLENLYIDARTDEKGSWGTVKVSAAFYDPVDYEDRVSLAVVITAPDGQEIWQTETELASFSDKEVLTETEWKKPVLWSDKTPKLYTCTVTLKTAAGEQTVTERFGFRHYEFKEHGPFMLNGQRVLLKGTHRHEDHAGVAAAMTEEMIRKEMQMIKEMGANFIRLGHYQQSDIVLNLCDELGIMVWEEIPWCRGGVGGEEYREQGRRMLTNMIRQHRNHPAVILWGLGNENDWPGDFPAFDKDSIRAYMTELNDLAHRLDDTRLTSIRRCDFCKDIVDVYSPSIWPGWYKGRYTDYRNVTYNEMMHTPRYLHVEWGGDSHARRFSENPYATIDSVDTETPFITDVNRAAPYTGKINVPGKGDWSESYICDLFDWVLKEQETMPWLTGAANWTFKDFSTPLRPENPIPYVNQKGVVERDLTPKESYYVFQSYWSEQPMLHIFGKEWVRSGKEGEPKQIRVYSNCQEVELFVNGESLGVHERNPQDFPAAGLRWESVLDTGVNFIKAIGRFGKGHNQVTLTEETTINYQTESWGAPVRITAQTETVREGLKRVEVQLCDERGIPCLDAANVVSFDYAGTGRMICNQGTSTGSRRLQLYNGRASIDVVQPKDTKGVVSVHVEGLPVVLVEL